MSAPSSKLRTKSLISTSHAQHQRVSRSSSFCANSDDLSHVVLFVGRHVDATQSITFLVLLLLLSSSSYSCRWHGVRGDGPGAREVTAH